MSTRVREKVIKDNVHGYIYINEEYFEIIDTALFQRLKNVKQTSYVSLYPSSTHDRFIHSLGTFYLGKLVMDGLWNNIGDGVDSLFSQSDKESITFTFEMACLLHDVGHAPFSHTGENFYIVKKCDDSLPNNENFKRYIEDNKITGFSYLDGLLINELANIYSEGKLEENIVMTTFLEDYSQVMRDTTPKAHERMSALIALDKLITQIGNISMKIYGSRDRFNADLFVRCIIGAQYKKTYRDANEAKKYSFYNAIISLLNSEVIDVDKLDYILRDNYMTGYENTGIDVERLIKSITIYIQGNYCTLAYKKNALSVIENVVRANDSSRRWVQNHPIILYDTYITQKCISETFKLLQKELNDDEYNIFERFFSKESLTLEGNEWAPAEHVMLASDMDVIMLIKKAYKKSNDPQQKELFEEFFARDKRRHPLWKSEAEYKTCIELQGKKPEKLAIVQDIKNAIVVLDTCKDKSTGVGEYIFTESTYETLKNTIPSVGRKLLNTIKDYFETIDKPLDIVILTTKGYASKIKKLDTTLVNVLMPNYSVDEDKYIYAYSELFQIEDSSSAKDIFYIYSKYDIDTRDFLSYLFNEGKFEA